MFMRNESAAGRGASNAPTVARQPAEGATGRADHRNNFNLLRFVFASLVILSHAPELRDGNRQHELLSRAFGTISFGELAVDSFFLLSGFLIVQSWRGRPEVGAFLRSRILRIYPGFIGSALVCAFLVGPFVGSTSYFQDFSWTKFSAGVAVLSLHGIPTVFPGATNTVINGAVWTIPYEFLCYLLVLGCGLAGVLQRRWTWLALFVASVAIHAADQAGVVHLPFALHHFARFAMAFTAGGCFQLYFQQIPWRRDLAAIALLLAIALLFSKVLAEPGVCLFWGYAVFFYAMAGRSLLRFNHLPDVSYGVYLYAWPINKLVLWAFPGLDLLVLIPAVFALSLLAGIASWYLVERPFMQLKKAYRRPPRFAPSVASA